MTTQRFRGILGIAALLAGLPPPPPVRRMEPELTQEQINEIVSRCEAAGVDYMELAERCQGDFLWFRRLAEAAIAAKTKPPAPEPTAEVTAQAGALRAAGATFSDSVPDDTIVTLRTHHVPRGPGLHIRDARARADIGLRDLAQRLGISAVELGEIERNLRPVSPDLWAAARGILALPEAMPPETALPRSIEGTERLVFDVDASLHPAGRCTCGGGGGGTCEWCRMDQRRSLREARTARRRGDLVETVDTVASQEALAGAREDERARKRETHRAKQARKAKRGW